MPTNTPHTKSPATGPIHPNISSLMSIPNSINARLDRIDQSTAEILQAHTLLQASVGEHDEQVRKGFTDQSHEILDLRSSVNASQADISRLSDEVKGLSRKVDTVSRKVDMGIQDLRNEMRNISHMLSMAIPRYQSESGELTSHSLIGDNNSTGPANRTSTDTTFAGHSGLMTQ
ncbi:unnamed protein product [Rhizoctonia solani]|uniref:Uncharacterized protein n=1 Tax=Rhizoctonia solani TaxID=456999 RepID=A0A8H2WVY2_9AGAM|nr:unnamed protein product [Rhizoctonia solani]